MTIFNSSGWQMKPGSQAPSQRWHPGWLPILILGCTWQIASLTRVQAEPGPGPDITWVEKYVTYQQEHHGALTLTDVHFLAEVAFTDRSDLDGIVVELYVDGEEQPITSYTGNDKLAFTNGYFYPRQTRSFDTLEALESVWPADTRFRWHIRYPDRVDVLAPIRIGGPGGSTDIPEPSTIRLFQHDAQITDHHAIDPLAPITIEWDPFIGGAPLEGSIWTDLVFVLVSDCRGKVVFTGGAPGTDDDFISYEETSVVMPGGLLEPGQPYVFFISQVNYVDHNVSEGVEQLAANSFATELPTRTSGSPDTAACPDPAKPAVYLWTRKTAPGQMEVWPTLQDHW